MNDTLNAVLQGFNVAVVFENKLPEFFELAGRRLSVIDGDEHDYRPADPKGVVVGLKVKGVKGKADTSGFVQVLAINTSIPELGAAA